MWWWKKKIVDQTQWADGVALRIFKGYRFVQLRWVKFMERLVRGWSVRKQKIVVVIAMVTASLYCAGLIYKSVNGRGLTMKVEKIETGEHIGSPKFDSTKLIR